jgi:putative colanic acid biosynthesis UDP-glucose lipid carrier transferase
VFATQNVPPRLLRTRLSLASLARVALDPCVVIATLFLTALAFGESFEGPYLILALLAFSLTFPGNVPQATGNRSLALEILVNWSMVVGVLLVLGWASHALGAFSSQVLMTWALTAPAALFAAHRLFPVILPRLLAIEGARRRAVVAGAGELGIKLARQFEASPFLGIRFVGFFDDRSAYRLGGVEAQRLLGSMESLPEFAKTNGIDLIYITLPMASQPRILKLLAELRDTTASIYFTPDIFLSDLIQARMDAVNGIPVVAVCETPFYGMSGLVKRLSDVVLASAILVVVSPVMLAAAIGVKLSSPGPVLFRQRRYGLDGKEIIVYKFRSMTVCEDGTVVQQASRNDRRVTRLGAFLRRTSLDELPQFVNVLQGRMSIVGPRPHAIAHNETYRKMINGYMVRHKVKPGITGWAQVNGLRGETETLEKMKARVDFDIAYLRNWSLPLDLKIILRTVWVVLKGRNAY